jgi:hypothetical protein
MDRAEIAASPRLRAAFLAVSASMLFLWGWSLIPLIENWNNPREDGFSAVPAFYGTLVCLPTGLFLLIGGIAPRGQVSCALALRFSGRRDAVRRGGVFDLPADRQFNGLTACCSCRLSEPAVQIADP